MKIVFGLMCLIKMTVELNQQVKDTPNELESTFGKDVANKIINRENLDEEGGNIGSLTGVDLKVGG